MENAAKALIMAGAVLLAILVLSLMNYLFENMAESSASIYEDLEESDITEFNQKFLNYDGRGTTTDDDGNPINPLNIQDVVTIVNIAKDNNENGKLPVNVVVKVGTEEWQNKDASELNDLLMQHIDDKYSCSVSYSTQYYKLVDKVTITEL